jgi:hypothetical protein
MTEGIRLGLQPDLLRVILSAGSDFTTTLQLDTSWPVGSTLTLVVGTLTWTATISGTDAVFSVDKAIADTVVDGTAARLVYVNGSSDQVWARGTAVRFDG